MYVKRLNIIVLWSGLSVIDVFWGRSIVVFVRVAVTAQKHNQHNFIYEAYDCQQYIFVYDG